MPLNKPETQQTTNDFLGARSLYRDEKETDLVTSNCPNGKSYEKTVPKREEA